MTYIVTLEGVKQITLDGLRNTLDTLSVAKGGVLLTGESTSSFLLLPNSLERLVNGKDNRHWGTNLLAGFEFVVHHTSVVESSSLFLIDLDLLSLDIGAESGDGAEDKR